MDKVKLCLILVISVILQANTQFVYKFTGLISCSDSVNESEWLYSLDQNEIVYEDYNTMQQIIKLPPFTDPINLPDFKEEAINDREECLQAVKTVRAAVGNPPEPKEPPEIVIYPKHDVVPGIENNFICFIKNFYPPHININWTRNGVSVTEGVYISQLSINSDGSFNVFSTLTSSPGKGDEYSCTVEHEALDSPQTRTWDEPVVTPSVTPAVVFGVGIAVGILGLFTGMFFVIKASRLC